MKNGKKRWAAVLRILVFVLAAGLKADVFHAAYHTQDEPGASQSIALEKNK